MMVVMAAVGLSACDDGDDGGAGGGVIILSDGGMDEDGSVGEGGENVIGPEGGRDARCSPLDFEEQAVAFCRAQAPDQPAPRTLGAPCQDDMQCESNVCNDERQCSLFCPRGDECPSNWYCDRERTRRDAFACKADSCFYTPEAFVDCLREINRELESVCSPNAEVECQTSAKDWLACLIDNGRICSQEQAGQACGIERIRVEECCPFCDVGRW
jgi:hypothetical protein